MLTISLAVAAVAFAGETVALDHSNAEPMLLLKYLFLIALPAIWGILVLLAIFRYRLRGLWFLMGAPLAMFWPVLLGLLFWACAQGKGCL